MTVAYVAAGLGVALLVWAALAFNGLVKAQTRVNESWSGVDVQLKRRHDLVPSLVETVSAYAQHEQHLLHATIDVRDTAAASSGRRGRQAAEHDLSEAIADVRVLGEQYPELRASEHFRRLLAQLAEVEGEIQYARRIYNSNVQLFNARVCGFPGSLVRRLGGFRAMGYFELAPVWRSSETATEESGKSQAAAA